MPQVECRATNRKGSNGTRRFAETNRAAGTDPEAVARGIAYTIAFYAPDPEAAP